MSVAEKAIWIIERNTGRDLTVDVIADRCDVSRSQLASADEARLIFRTPRSGLARARFPARFRVSCAGHSEAGIPEWSNG